MDQNAATYELPPSTAQDTVTLQNGVVAPSSFEIWEGNYYPYLVQEQMEWLSPGNQPCFVPDQTYLTSLQHSFADPALTASTYQCDTSGQPQGQLTPTSTYSSHHASTSSAPGQTLQALDPVKSEEHGTLPRPQSAETMLDSGSSNESRTSSISNSPLSRPPKFKVPAIKTQFEDKDQIAALHGTPVIDGIQVAPDTDSMTAMSTEWMHVHDNNDQHGIHDQTLSAVSLKASPALLEPFQWQSPATRRTSVSSAVSGPVFSPYGTPTSAVWQTPGVGSPYAQQNWTPISNPHRLSISPQSPHARNYHSWSRMQYFNALRQNRHGRPAANSLPGRNKPRMIRNITDGFIPAPNILPTQSRTRSTETRARVKGDDAAHASTTLSQQLALPEFPPATFFASPDVCQVGFRSGNAQTPTRHALPSSTTQTPMAPPSTASRTHMTPNFNTLNVASPYVNTQPFPRLPTNAPLSAPAANPISTPAHQPPLPVPSEPPLSDFLTTTNTNGSSTSSSGNHPPACGPIRQSPHFEGDIYTPRYKRRNAAGKWEGWCGYCQPGRWLDLKNSRYWEDKLRNHGICARTKTFFEGPLRVRWVSDRGTIWEGEAGDSSFDITSKEGIDDDGIGRKREGLCGECNKWVGMDGMRSRGKGRCVAWWMHAYKCHEQSKSRTDGTGTFEQV